MKCSILFALAFLLITINIQAQKQEFYKLKTYTFSSLEQAERTDIFLKDTYLPAIKKQGIKNVGVFKNRTSDQDTVFNTYVLIPSTSVSQLAILDEQMLDQGLYGTGGQDYLNASHDNPPYERIESILMRAFSEMPALEPSPLKNDRSQRIYELRSYESPTELDYKNKVDMFNAGGEVTLFDRLGFNAVFYAEVISGPNMPNLMYMTTHANEDAMKENWKAFVDSPKWKELKAMEKYKNNMSHIDKYLLYPTEYSDY